MSWNFDVSVGQEKAEGWAPAGWVSRRLIHFIFACERVEQKPFI